MRSTVLSGDIGLPMAGAVTAYNLSPEQPADINDSAWKDNISNVLVGNRVTDVLLDNLVITGGSAMADDTVIPQLNIDGMELFTGAEGDLSTLVTTVVPVSPLVAGGGLFFTAPERKDEKAPADLTVSRCVFTRNHARGFGGAIVLRDAVVDLSNTSFRDNVADLNGGAISALNSTIYAASCDFTNNTGNEAAGAVDLKAFPKVEPEAPAPDESTGIGGPGSDRDRLRVGLGHALSGILAVKKGVVVAATEGGMGAQFRAALPENPFAADKAIGGRVAAAYALFTLGVSVGDQGVNLAKTFGVDPNDQHIKNWESFSYHFNTYATPQGLFSLGAEQLGIALKKWGIDKEIPTLPLSRTLYKRQVAGNFNTASPSFFIFCRFNGNKTQGEGGALLNLHANMRVENSWFLDNSAATNGGAISAGGYTMPRIINSVFQNNKSKSGHSAMANGDHSSAQVVNCTFYQNSSENAFGFALSAERGSSVRVSNSVFWGNLNAATANLTGGADVFAATAADLDADTRKTLYDGVGGGQVDQIGTMQLKNCNLQSLDRIPLGTPLNPYYDILDILPDGFARPNTELDKFVAQFHRLDANGETELAGIHHSGEGIRSDLRSPAQANFSTDPQFVPGSVVPSSSSPLIDKGSDARLLVGAYTHPRTTLDAADKLRRVGGAVDVGAIEAQPQVAPLVEVAQAGNPDWTLRHVFVKPIATGDGSGSSWANATDKLAVAMNSLAAEVWVAAGTYRPAIANRD
ncbi:MAG: hypothetical protein EOP84_13735, partial [Verrucomicrobiaceae bacterium]